MVKRLKLIVVLISVMLFSSSLWAVEKTVVYLSFQQGQLDTGAPAPIIGKEDQYLQSIETKHGDLQNDRKVNPDVISFDFYRTKGKIASGFGMDLFRYNKTYQFSNDSTEISISASGITYGFNFYYRGDFWFPFVGFGMGNYMAKVTESLITNNSLTSGIVYGQTDNPLYYKFGVRIPFNGWGMIFTQQYTAADLYIPMEGKTLSLGGTATLFGLYHSF